MVVTVSEEGAVFLCRIDRPLHTIKEDLLSFFLSYSEIFYLLLWVQRVLVAFDHSQRHTHTHSRYGSLDEGSAGRRDFYMTPHNTCKRKASIFPAKIRTRDTGERATADPHHRLRGHRDRPSKKTNILNFSTLNNLKSHGVMMFL